MSNSSSCTCSSSIRSRSSFESGSSWSASLSCSDLTTQLTSQVDLTSWNFEDQLDPADASLRFMKLDVVSNDVSTQFKSLESDSPSGGRSKWSFWIAKREKKKKAVRSSPEATGSADENVLSQMPKIPVERTSELENLISSRNEILDLCKSTSNDIVLPTVGDEFIVLYINTESIKNENEIGCYQFPKNDSNCCRSFSKLKGLFITLIQVVQDTVHEKPLNSIIELKEGEKSVKYIISYQVFGEGILVVAIEESVQEYLITIKELSDAIETLVTLLFHPFTACFGNNASEIRLDRLLTTLHRTLFSKPNKSIIRPSYIEKLITSDDELDLSISEVLTEYETMDWVEEIECENQEEVIASCLNYIVIGSSLLRNGFMIMSHYDQQVNYLVNRYLFCTGLLETSKSWDCKILFFHPIHLPGDDLQQCSDKYWLMVIGIEHTIFTIVLLVPFTNWSIDIAVQSILLRESIKFVQSNLINSGLMGDIDRILYKQDCQFQSSFNQMMNRRRSAPSFLGVKSRSFRNLLSNNLGRSSFLSPENISVRAHSTSSLIQSNSTNSFGVKMAPTLVSTESKSSSMSVHNFLRPEQESNVTHQSFTLFIKIDPLSRTIISPVINWEGRVGEDDIFNELKYNFRKIVSELEKLTCNFLKDSMIESGKLMIIGKEKSLFLYVTREEIGNEILFCATNEISCNRDVLCNNSYL